MYGKHRKFDDACGSKAMSILEYRIWGYLSMKIERENQLKLHPRINLPLRCQLCVKLGHYALRIYGNAVVR
jgi:hypothetical protein